MVLLGAGGEKKTWTRFTMIWGYDFNGMWLFGTSYLFDTFRNSYTQQFPCGKVKTAQIYLR